MSDPTATLTAAEYLAWRAQQPKPSASRATGKRAPARLRAHLDALTVPDPPTVLHPPAPPPADIAEADFQRLVIDLARWQGWLVWHDRDSRGNDAGLPDLLLLRDLQLLWWELKTNHGKVRPEQTAFGARLIRAGQDWRIVRPRDWEYVVATLTRRIDR